MGLNKQAGNMYGFVTHTWNTIKGKCYHDCSYCYMKRFPQNEVRFDNKELNTNLGEDNFIFVGSSCDMFSKEIPSEWIGKTLDCCRNFNNTYLFQSKNPYMFIGQIFPKNTIICTTIESNREYSTIYNNSPRIIDRVNTFRIKSYVQKMITIEPILDFDLERFVEIIKDVNPFQVNIGADSGHNNLPEPSKEKTLDLIKELESFTKVYIKDNLKRIIK